MDIIQLPINQIDPETKSKSFINCVRLSRWKGWIGGEGAFTGKIKKRRTDFCECGREKNVPLVAKND